MPMRPLQDPRINAFYLMTGVTFMAFASGFGVCLFNLETVDACVEVANNWVVVFHRMGDHLLAWGIALYKAVFHV